MGFRLTFHGAVLAATIAVLSISAVAPARQVYREKTAIGAEQAKLGELRRSNAGLEQRLQRLNDPEYLEKVAREELGLVRPGEISYVVVPASNVPAHKPAAPKRNPWYQRLWRNATSIFR
jgi:cell division protein FtsB